MFELNRHGARSADSDDEPGRFNVPSGMLTATGMRQRFLLGRYNREKYIDEYGLLDPKFNPGQVYAQSTGVDRTLQSAYSQLLGMYPPITT